ncbi:MAG: hypothetical protein RI988_1654 [Pseudomonadota bacterium]|jgi:hypothetical protein
MLDFTWIALACAASLAAAAVAWGLRGRTRVPTAAAELPAAWPLQSRPVFTAEERRVYRQLVDAFPHHAVLVKLPLARFCQPEEPGAMREWHRVLGSHYVTFALCSASGRVVAAVDLEGGRMPSERSLRIKQEVFAACRVRYLRCHPDQVPSAAELQLLVPQGAAGMRGPQPATGSPPHPHSQQPAGAEATRRGRRPLWRDPGILQESYHGRQDSSATAPSSILPLIDEQASLRRGREAAVDLSQDLAEALGDVATRPPMSARH